MPTPSHPQSNEYPSTYFVQDRHDEQELARVTIQDRMLTASMGGVLPEQSEPTSFRRVLDVGCGTGGWLLDLAEAYPKMSLVGIDSSKSMVEFARAQADAHHVSDRVEFHVMDALLILEFPPAYFDLVNIRLGSSFVRIWEWHKLIGEMLRMCHTGGTIRVLECENGVQSSSQALIHLFEMSVCAMYRSGHLFEPSSTGITVRLPGLLTQYGCQQVQAKRTALQYHAGTPEGQAFCEDMRSLFQTGRPFLQRWGCITQEYEALCQQALTQMQQPDFWATWNVLTVWGHVSH